MADRRYEVTVLIGPCSEEDSETFAVSILDLPLAQAVHAAVAITRLDQDEEEWIVADRPDAQQAREALTEEREAWYERCHFCKGPSYPWLTDDATWLKVEPLLGQQQACFECFGAAWFLLGHNDGEPFVVTPAALASRLASLETERETRGTELLRRLAACGSHLIALGRPDLAPFGEQIVCPRCEGQTYDVDACGLCGNVGWLNESGEALP